MSPSTSGGPALSASTTRDAPLQRLKEEFDLLRSRYVYKLMDAALTASLGASYFGPAVPPVVDAGSRSYRRAQSLANLAATLLPRTFQRLQRKLINAAFLPFAGFEVRLLSFGSGSTVFLLEGPGPEHSGGAYVLKVFRKSLGRRREALFEQVRQRRSTYRQVATWYADCAVVPPTHFLILQGPLLGRPAVGCLQPYVSGPYLDLFDDIGEDDLLRLLEGHPGLRAQFRRFVRRTLHAAHTDGACIDLAGRNNLVLDTTPHAPRLLLLDLGVYDFRRKAGKAGLEIVKHRLERLRSLDERLGRTKRPVGIES